MFRNNISLYQLRVNQTRRKDPVAVIRDSWSYSKPLELFIYDYNVSEFPRWPVTTTEIDPNFRICFDFYKNNSHRNYYERRHVKDITVECEIDSKQDKFKLFENCTYDESMNQIALTMKVKTHELDKIKVDLRCHIHYSGKFTCQNCKFTYNQPVILQMKSTLNRADSSIVAISIVLLIFTLSTAIIFYYYRNTRSEQKSIVSSTPSPTMFWEENPNYSRYDSLDTLDNNPLYPNWLENRSDMIYDSRCIKKEKKLGQGHFGTVFEGKIWLGNAV